MSIKFSDRTGRKNHRPINAPESRLFSALVFIVGVSIAAAMFAFVLFTFFPVLLLK